MSDETKENGQDITQADVDNIINIIKDASEDNGEGILSVINKVAIANGVSTPGEYLATINGVIVQLNIFFTKLLEEVKKNPKLTETIEAQSVADFIDSPLLDTLAHNVLNSLKLQDLENLPRNFAKEVKELDYPVGKVNRDFWKLFEQAKKDGQIAIAVEKKGQKPLDVLYSVKFDDLPDVSITKTLTAFDKRVYIAAGAIYNNGNEVMTLSQIHAAMGNTGRPSSAQAKKINDAITKMNSAHIFIDNINEHKALKNRAKNYYDGSLLPMERVTQYMNNVLTEGAIHLFRQPPLIQIAAERKQITTIPRILLESPISKTEANLRIDDYLIDRISQMKNRSYKSSNKILYSTLFEECEIKTVKQKERSYDKIRTYLTHYKEIGFIKDFKESKTGITITY